MLHITENQLAAIQYLANFKYLTSSQFVKMGVYKRRGYLTNSLKSLIDVKKPLIDKHDFNPINGKVESLYYLTKYGKKFLIEELEYKGEQIKAPSGYITAYLKDYFHRKMTIDFHIYLREWLNENDGKIIFLDYYFDKAGNNRSKDKGGHVTALNRIEIENRVSFIPDINFMFTTANKKHLFLFEQHNGKDTKRLFEQLYIHIIAISKGVVSDKYKHKNKAHKVVVLCEQESVKDSVIKRLQKVSGIEKYYNFFIFKTNAELKQNFYNNWTLISGEQVNFIQKSTSVQ